MKLNEIKTLREAEQIVLDIEDWVHKHMRYSGDFEIDPDTKALTFHGDTWIEDFDGFELPHKIDLVDGKFTIHNCLKLENLKNTPNKVRSKYVVAKCPNLESLEGLSLGGGLNEITFNRCGGLSSFKHFPLATFGQSLTILDCVSLYSLEDLHCKTLYKLRIESCDNLRSLKGLQLNTVDSIAIQYCDRISSVEGVPAKINKNFKVADCPSLKLDEHMPTWVGGEFSVEVPIVSLREITDHLKHAMFIELYEKCIPTEGFLGAFDVEGLTAIIQVADSMKILNEPIQIVSSHLASGDVFECQTELIEKGFEKEAT